MKKNISTPRVGSISRIKGHWFWNRTLMQLLHMCIKGLKKFSCRAFLLFYCLFLVAQKAFKCFLECAFIPWLLTSFDLNGGSSELRESYTLRRDIHIHNGTQNVILTFLVLRWVFRKPVTYCCSNMVIHNRIFSLSKTYLLIS